MNMQNATVPITLRQVGVIIEVQAGDAPPKRLYLSPDEYKPGVLVIAETPDGFQTDQRREFEARISHLESQLNERDAWLEVVQADRDKFMRGQAEAIDNYGKLAATLVEGFPVETGENVTLFIERADVLRQRGADAERSITQLQASLRLETARLNYSEKQLKEVRAHRDHLHELLKTLSHLLSGCGTYQMYDMTGVVTDLINDSRRMDWLEHNKATLWWKANPSEKRPGQYVVQTAGKQHHGEGSTVRAAIDGAMPDSVGGGPKAVNVMESVPECPTPPDTF